MNAYSDTDITPQEMQRLSEALKNEEFKSLFLDYVNEISDPENRNLYEAELIALEAEQGRDLTFVNPEPHFTVKTRDSLYKVFINICSSDAINEAVAKKSDKGSHWSIPYSLGNPRDDVDAGQKPCKVYDAVFHSKTLARCTSDARFKDLIISSAIEGIEKQFKTMLDKKYNLPKLKVKGTIPSTVIRVKKEDSQEVICPKGETSSEFLTRVVKNQPKNLKKKEQVAEIKVPEYTIVHQGVISDYTDFTNTREKSGTRPDVLLVKVKLPKIESISQIELDTFEKFVELVVPGIYKVQIPLPFSVAHDKGTAKFDTAKKELCVSLPVIKPAFLKPDKVLIEEVKDEEQEAVSADTGTCVQETVKPCVSKDTGLLYHAPIKEINDERIDQKKVPIFHMRQDVATVSIMIPQHIKKDDSKIQLEEESIIFEFLHGNESYRLHIKFQDKIQIATSIIEIEDSHALIMLTKEVQKDWDFVNLVYSQGMTYKRRFSKIMSEAENELWINPSELLKKPNAYSPNSGKEDTTSNTLLIDKIQVSASTEIHNDLAVHDGQIIVPKNEGEISEMTQQLQNSSINEDIAAGQEISELVESSAGNESVGSQHSAAAEIIKNSYLFELDD